MDFLRRSVNRARGFDFLHLECRRQFQSAAGKLLVDSSGIKYLPFELTVDDAKKKYEQWQRKENVLAPINLLSSAKNHSFTPLYLPYWLFTINAKIQYCATVHLQSSMTWKSTDWITSPQEWTFPLSHPDMQVYASFQQRRDFAQAMKSGIDIDIALDFQSKAREFSDHQKHRTLAIGGIDLETPQIRKGLAWEFALRGAHSIAERRVVEELKKEYKVDIVKDVNVVLSPSKRQASLLYVPAYALHYVYGETHNVHGERHAQHFDGLVSGLKNGGVAGEKHLSIPKAATYGGGIALGTMGLLSVVSPLLGADPFMWSSFDFMFGSASAGAISGLIAQIVPKTRALKSEQHHVSEEAAMEVGAMATPPSPPLEGFLQGARNIEETRRSHLEWLRWEESNKVNWDPKNRERWAYQLWEAQHVRRRERKRRFEQAEKERMRREDEDLREKRRRSRWGPSSTEQQDFLGGARGRRDFKGYYKVLDLDPTASHISEEEVKKAFRKAALKWHPDRHADPYTKRKAREHFHAIRTAYDTLKDPSRRKQYDQGIIIQQ